MALKLNERYPARFDNPSADYPQGSFKNRTSPTAKDGSYLEKDWANDKEGFFQSLISASGLVPSGVTDKVGASQYYDAMLTVLYAAARKTPVLTDTGTAGVYAAANTPALTALPSTGYMQRVKIANANAGASTYAPDGLAAKPVYGLALKPLQGGELPAGVAVLMYLVQAGVNGGNGAWIIVESLGGASQIPPATQSQHAMQLGQAVGRLLNVRVITATTTYTPTIGTTSVVVKLIGGGGSGGGCSATGVGQASVSSGGSGGGYCLKRIVTGFAGVTITIGAGGTAQAPGAAGVSGGTTSFGALCSATGGSGGLSGVATGTFPSLTGASQPGAGSNGDVNGSGDWANISMILSSSYLFQSLGESGGSVIGGSVRVPPDDVSASPVANTGAGGSAVGCSASKSPRAGGAGGSGVAIILEYA